MRGTISAIAPDGTYGQITTSDGQKMSYWTSEIRNGTPQVGQAVEFQVQDNQPIDIFIAPSARPAPPPMRGPMPPPMMQGGPRARRGPATAMAATAVPKDRNYWITLLTSPSGRISRRQFWLHGVLLIVVANVLLAWIPLVGQLISLVLMWSSICIAFKRFHDCGYPGWWSFLYLVPLIVGGVIFALSFYFLDSDWPARVGEGLWVIAGLMLLAQLIFVYVRAGQQGPNQYGPDPLEPAY